MSPEENKLTLHQLLFSFDGRINRKIYWLYCFAPLFLIGTIAAAANAGPELILALTIMVAWPSLALHVKRWHDMNQSGWWQLISLIPVLGGFYVLIVCGFVKGTEGPNQFG
jgi:uncharacterized membrane protein YhaH (DUF805 family)